MRKRLVVMTMFTILTEQMVPHRYRQVKTYQIVDFKYRFVVNQSYPAETLKNVLLESLKKEIEINADFRTDHHTWSSQFKMLRGRVRRGDFTSGGTGQDLHLLQTY